MEHRDATNHRVRHPEVVACCVVECTSARPAEVTSKLRLTQIQTNYERGKTVLPSDGLIAKTALLQ